MNYELRVIVMYQCRFITCNRCTTLVGDVDVRVHVCVGTGGVGEISLSSSKCCCEL